MIRQIVNGISSAEPDTCYCVQDGSTKRGEKIYVVKNGEAKLCWDRPGSRSNPYQIWTVDDLQKVKKDPGGYYLLMKDIVIPTGNTDYLPILWEAPFTGVFDGQGHRIYSQSYSSGTTVNMAGKTVKDNDPGSTSMRSYSCGLFGINMGIITRIDLTELPLFFTQSTNRYGVVVGSNRGIVDQIKLRTTNRLCNDRTHFSGGIAGHNSGTIQNCTNENGSYSTDYMMGCAGGMACYTSGMILNCSGYLNVKTGSTYQQGALCYTDQPGSIIRDFFYTKGPAIFDDYYKENRERTNIKQVYSTSLFPKIDFSTVIY